MGKKDRIFLTGISVLLVLSLSPIVFNEAFAGIPNGNEMPPAVGPIGDFRCWLTDAPPPPPTVFPLSLTDQFGEMILGPGQIGPAIEFCASAVKNGDPGQFDIRQHFTGYPLFTEPMPERTVRVFIPQFGIDIPELRVSQPTELLVPTTKIAPSGEPFPNLTGLHYKCYDIRENPSVRIPGHLLETQFFPETILDEELQPKYLCNPTIKTLPTGEMFGAEIREHLICFEKPGAPAPVVQIVNQFTENQLVPIPLLIAEKVCYEAIKTEIEVPPDGGTPIGGELIPIDSTSLILAGAQMTAAWMIPVIIAGAGIVLVFVRKSKNS